MSSERTPLTDEDLAMLREQLETAQAAIDARGPGVADDGPFVLLTYTKAAGELLLEEVERLQSELDAPEVDPDEIDRELAARPRRFTHVLRGRLEPVADQPEDADIAACRAQLVRLAEQRRQAAEEVGEDPSEWTVNAPPGARERARIAELEAARDSWRRVCERLEGENRALRLELQGHREIAREEDRIARGLIERFTCRDPLPEVGDFTSGHGDSATTRLAPSETRRGSDG